VVLCDLEGLSYDEVAEALGVKLGTVRSRIHRGRTMLREKLAHRDPRPQQSRPKLSLPRIAGIL
jgi:DNA-directed RNA polymerase specialized sigma24 family protein